jgi:phage FluMu protein Com
MMTNIECTKCGDVIAVESRSVVLPFVCMACESAIATFTQEVEAPAPLTDEQVEVAKFYEAMSPASETPELSEEFATVENTTKLIEDLETQLSVAKQRSDELKLTVENLVAKNQHQSNIINQQEAKIRVLLAGKRAARYRR